MTPKPQENLYPTYPGDATEGYVNNSFEIDKTSNGHQYLDVVGHQKPPPTITTTTGPESNGSAQAIKQITDFDDLLPYIGEFGRYQKILFLLMIPFAFFVAFVYFSQIFITLVPDEHWCAVPDLQHLSVDERMALSIPREGDNGGYSKCSMYDVNYKDILNTNVTVADPSWPVVACKYGWDYNFTDIPYATVATELNWVCEDSFLPTMAQSIFFLGAITGGLLFGWIADRYGRIPALAGCNLIGFAAGVLTAFSQSFWFFSVCRFFVGFAFDNCFTMMYILVLEYVGPKWRTFVANMSIAIFFTIASCALPWIAYYLADWKLFALVTSAPLALAIFTPLCVPESARWLVSQGKHDQAITILKKFEKLNRTKVDPQIYENFRENCVRMQEEEASNSNYSILDLFRTPRLRKITLLLIGIWMAISLVFDGHVRNVGSLGLDLFFTFTVAAATELPADTFLTLTLDRWGRRWLAFGTMVSSGVFSLLATMVPVGAASASLAIVGRFSVNISYNIGLQYAAELLPTVVRAQGVAFIHIMGYVASILAPFIVHLAQYYQSLPLIILGILGIVGGCLSLFLPETLDKELPQSLDDGEKFGLDQKLWDFPCVKKPIIEQEPESPPPGHFLRNVLANNSARASLRGGRGEVQSSMLQRSLRARLAAKQMAEA